MASSVASRSVTSGFQLFLKGFNVFNGFESFNGLKIVYASRIPPRPIGGQRLGNSLFCGRQILQNSSRGSSKISPRGSQGLQKSFSGVSGAASWAVRAQLGTHFDTRKAILTNSGLILELLELILAARATISGATGFHFEHPGALCGSILSILQQFC